MAKILVVDDEDMLRLVVVTMLESMGHSCLQASDGAEALRIFGEHKDGISLALLDLTMPRMTGEELFRHLRKQSGQLKVILMSGYSDNHSLSPEEQSGLAAFLQKPFGMKILRETVDKILSGSPPS